MKWGQRNETLLRARGIGPDARYLYLMLRHEIAHVCGIVDVSAETMTRHCEFTRQARTVAALAVLTKTDDDQKLGDRPPMFIWDDYLPLGYIADWCEWSPPQNHGQLASRLSFLATLPDCPAKTAAIADLEPYLNQYPPQERRPRGSDDAPAAPDIERSHEPLPRHEDDLQPPPARRPRRTGPADVNPATPQFLSDLYGYYLPLRPQLSPFELGPSSGIGARMAQLVAEQPKPRAWRTFFAHAAKLCDDKGKITVDGQKVSVTMRTLLDKQLGDYVLAVSGVKKLKEETHEVERTAEVAREDAGVGGAAG